LTRSKNCARSISTPPPNPPQYRIGLALPLDGPNEPAESHSCARRSSGPSPAGVPASRLLDKSIEDTRDTQLALLHGLPRLGDLYPLHRARSLLPFDSRSLIASQCSFEYPGNSFTVIPSTPGLPCFYRTRFNATRKLSRAHIVSIRSSPNIGRSVLSLAMGKSAFAPGSQGFTSASRLEVLARTCLPFILPLRASAYLPLHTVWAFSSFPST
jgi:hypothetical protein